MLRFESITGSVFLKTHNCEINLISIYTIIGTYSYETELFGENVKIYAETDNNQKINKDFSELYQETEKQATGEFTSTRFAALFKSGDYDDVELPIGYYTSVAGLGYSPDDVSLGDMHVKGENSDLINFWRGAENLSVNTSNMIWSVSQATWLRRIHAKGNVSFSRIKPNGQASANSGGYTSDCLIDGTVNSMSQQQWLTRNSKFSAWEGNVFNLVFMGNDGAGQGKTYNATTQNTFNDQQHYTTLERTPKVAAKPFLTYDEVNGYRVFVPAVKENTKSYDWATAESDGKFLSLEDDFYIAKSVSDTSATINAALASGKHILFTPGVYTIDKALNVTKANTVLLGMGLATLKVSDSNADTLIRVGDVSGVRLAGLLLDSGKSSESLMEIGTGKGSENSEANPVVVNDLFFRAGGGVKTATKVKKAFIVHTDHTIIDHIWVWRADHSNGQGQTGWGINEGEVGVEINGDNVLCYGLMVEHFQKYQTIFNGEHCMTVMYQSEIPYDIPNQLKWTAENGANGYASYKVADTVTVHTAYGLGVYSNFDKENVLLDSAIETPEAAGISFTHVYCCNFRANNLTSYTVYAVNHTAPLSQNRLEGGKYVMGTVSLERFPES